MIFDISIRPMKMSIDTVSLPNVSRYGDISIYVHIVASLVCLYPQIKVDMYICIEILEVNTMFRLPCNEQSVTIGFITYNYVVIVKHKADQVDVLLTYT